MMFESALPPLEEVEIRQRLRDLGLSVIEPVVEHFARLNGAEAIGVVAWVGGREVDLDALVGFGYRLSDLEDLVDAIDGRAPRRWVPIATACSRQTVFLVTTAGAVVYWDPDLGITPAYSSIQAFMDGLTGAVLPPPEDWSQLPLPELLAKVVRLGFADRAGWYGRVDLLPLLRADHPNLVPSLWIGLCGGNHVAAVRQMLDDGFGVDTRLDGRHDGRIGLASAAIAGAREVVELLLARGADPTAQVYGTPILQKTSDPEILAMLRKAVP